MMGLTVDLSPLDWRQPWSWPRAWQRVVWVSAGILGVLLLSPWWVRSWQDWDAAHASQTQLAVQREATQALRLQTTHWQHMPNQTDLVWRDASTLAQSAQEQGLQLSHMRWENPLHSPALHALHMQALHMQALNVHLTVDGDWEHWLAWLTQWPSAAPGVTVSSLELTANPRGGISAQMLAVVPQTMATDTGFVRAHKSLDVHAPTDPFSSQTWLNTQRAHAAQHPSYERWVAPELLRARNVLEAYPRERLQYVGYLASKGELEALINVLPPPGVPQDTSVMSVHRVRVGQHLGQDFGKLLAVESDQLVVQALALSPTGEWHPHVVRWPLHKVTP